MCRKPTLPATVPSTERHSSIIVVPTLERAFNLDTWIICLFLKRVQEVANSPLYHRALWQEVDVDVVGIKPTRHDHPMADGEDGKKF